MKLSVIIPVYNSESSIISCLNSVKQQTYVNFEVVIVNDGSTDNTQKLIEEFIENDSRFILLNQTNHGVSVSRNIGIDKASGEFITFLDSDDELLKTYLEDLIKDYQSKPNVDLVCQGLIKVFDNKKCVFKNEKNNIYKSYDYNSLFKDAEITLKGNPVAKLYKSKIILDNNLKFKTNITYNEDKIFVLEYIYYCDGNILFSDKCNYKYLINIGSLSNGLLKPDEYWKPYEYFKSMLINKFNIDYKNQEYKIIYQNFKKYQHMFLNAVFVHDSSDIDKYLSYFNDEDKYIYRYISINESSLLRKIFDFLLLKKKYKILSLFSKIYLNKRFNR